MQGLASAVRGEAWAKVAFPDCWKTQLLNGTVTGNEKRSVLVKWDGEDLALKTGSRNVARNGAPAAAAAPAGGGGAPAAAAARAGGGGDIIHEVGSDDEPEEVGDGALDPGDEAAAAEPGDDLLAPHGVQWTVKAGGVTVEAPEVARRRQTMHPRINWRDQGLGGNDRSESEYFMHFYPTGHIAEMLQATNANLDAHGGDRHLTQQEYFMFVGLLLLASLFSSFPMEVLFRAGAAAGSWCERFRFLAIPNLRQYMTYDRFKKLMRCIAFALEPAAGEQHGTFWKVQPLVDAFNTNRTDGFTAGWKLVVDESMSSWRGHDQRYGPSGCPHVTKITRKPKGVGIEIKDLCDVESGVMLGLEPVGSKAEMDDREYQAALGAGTALLLRLTKRFHGTGRLVLGDSAFASVKAAFELKTQAGLDFIGLVKTATRKFPKKYMDSLNMAERGDHAVLTATDGDVDLTAVAWKEGKKGKDGEIIKKNFIATCGTTLPGKPHKKKRWDVHADGSLTHRTVDVKRPCIAGEYFDGAQAIDVHNHARQGSLALESRRTTRWDWRFFQSFLGIVEVDAFTAYKHFCPGKADIDHSEFLLEVVNFLLDNKIGVGSSAPVLRARAPLVGGGSDSEHEEEASSSDDDEYVGVHELRPLTRAAHFKDAARAVLKCRECKMKCYAYCASCTKDDSKPRRIVALCGIGNDRQCFVEHQNRSIAGEI